MKKAHGHRKSTIASFIQHHTAMSVLDRRPLLPADLPTLKELQRVNGVLPPVQDALLRQFMDDCQSYMDVLSQELVHLHSPTQTIRKELLKGAIRAVIRESKKTESFILSYKPFLSARRRVPPEIWSQIFIFCLTGRPSSSVMAPLVLCRVCSDWREIAENEPSLWRTVDFLIDCHSSPSRWRSVLSRLERIRAIPAHVILLSVCSASFSLEFDPMFSRFVQTTASHWRSLDYSVSYYPNSYPTHNLDSSLIFVPMPSLETLVLDITHFYYSPQKSLDMPNLRSLTLQQGFSDPMVAFRPVWPKLTELILQACMTSEFVDTFLSSHPKLERLVIHLPLIAPPVHAVPHCLSMLVSLELWTTQPGDFIIPIIGQFTLPSLRYVKYGERGHWENANVAELILASLTRKQCPLATLIFQGISCDAAERKLLVKRASSIETLRELRVYRYLGDEAPNLLDGAVEV